MQTTIFNPNLCSYEESKWTLTIAYYKVLIIVVSKTLTANQNPQGFKELVNFDHIKGDLLKGELHTF